MGVVYDELKQSIYNIVIACFYLSWMAQELVFSVACV